MGLGLRYKNEEQIFQEQYTEPPYLEYPMFRETGIVKHGFSTRIGGVSKGCFSSLNLSFTRGDEEEAVREISEGSDQRWESDVRIWCLLTRHIRPMCG